MSYEWTGRGGTEDVTWDGKLFQIWAVAIRKAQSPLVWLNHVWQMGSNDVGVDCRWDVYESHVLMCAHLVDHLVWTVESSHSVVELDIWSSLDWARNWALLAGDGRRLKKTLRHILMGDDENLLKEDMAVLKIGQETRNNWRWKN